MGLGGSPTKDHFAKLLAGKLPFRLPPHPSREKSLSEGPLLGRAAKSAE